jgi:threonine dehydrogenase-like Zn-dependent dehydrogenase
LDGIQILSASQIAAAIAATGSLSGIVNTSQTVLISAGPIDAVGDLSALSAISVDQLATALSAGGSLQGTPSISNGVVIAAGPIAALSSLHGLSVIAVDVSAQILSAAGELLGTVQLISPGNVLVSADPIQSAGSLQGSPVLYVANGGVISASGFTAGDGYASLVIEATPIAGAGSNIGGYRIDVDISAMVIDAMGEVTGDLVRNVLQAAAAIVGNGQLVGTAQIVGPGQLGEITQPGIISNTPRYTVISVTPRRGTLN